MPRPKTPVPDPPCDCSRVANQAQRGGQAVLAEQVRTNHRVGLHTYLEDPAPAADEGPPA